MKSIHRNFEQVVYKYPDYSSFVCFEIAIEKKGFSKDRIKRAFSKLVSKEDYIGVRKSEIHKNLFRMSDPKNTR